MKRGGRRTNVHAYFVTKLWGVRSGQKCIRKRRRGRVQLQLVMCELRTQGRENRGVGEDKRMEEGGSTLSNAFALIRASPRTILNGLF